MADVENGQDWARYVSLDERLGAGSRYQYQDGRPGPSANLITICDSACVAATFFFLIARLWVRHRGKSRNLEDIIITLAWLTFTAAMYCEISAAGLLERYSIKENPGATLLERINGFKTAYDLTLAMNVLYHAPLYLVKLAWLRFFYLIVPVTLRWMRFILHTTTILCIVGWTTTSGYIIYFSVPFAEMWRNASNIKPSGSLEYRAPLLNIHVVLSNFIFHCLTQLLIYVIPIIILIKLKDLALHYKIQIVALLTLGLGCFAWLVINMMLSYYNIIPGDSVLACVVWPFEPAYAIIIICLPAFKPNKTKEPEPVVAKGKEVSRESTMSEIPVPPHAMHRWTDLEPGNSRRTTYLPLDLERPNSEKREDFDWFDRNFKRSSVVVSVQELPEVKV